MICWGFFQPFVSYRILTRFTCVDAVTASAISACFGSVSVMTFAAGASFLDKFNIPYESLVVAILAVMEVPAIISGLLLSKSKVNNSTNLLKHTFLNKTILMIFFGMFLGMLFHKIELNLIPSTILFFFKPSLCYFLFNMGFLIGKQKDQLQKFSSSLLLFGCYMPLIGSLIGILISKLFGLDPGTGTLISVLCASASYIAAPASMKIAVPDAKEAIYLPLSLGIAFPFNVLFGIPFYFFLAEKFL
jgi:hypothetical protein